MMATRARAAGSPVGRRGIAAAGIGVAVVGAAIAYTTLRPPTEVGSARESYSFAYVTPVGAGDTLTYGAVAIPNPDAEPLTVLSVVPNAAHLEVIDVVAVLPAEQAEFGIYHGGRGWPATDEVPVERRAIGHDFLPGDFAVHVPGWPRLDLQLLIGMRTDGAYLSGLNGVTVEYVLGGERHTREFPGAMIACAGPLVATCGDRDAETDLRELGLLE